MFRAFTATLSALAAVAISAQTAPPAPAPVPVQAVPTPTVSTQTAPPQIPPVPVTPAQQAQPQQPVSPLGVPPAQAAPAPVQPLGIVNQPPAGQTPHVSSSAPETPPATVSIGIADAIRLALSEGTQAQLARSAEARARYNERAALSALLPRADVNVMRYSQSINLETFGFAQPGQPPVVGPFNVTDGQINAALQLFNYASYKRLQAARSGVAASKYQVQSAENDIAAAVTRLYVLVARADAQIASRQADVTLFEQLARVAADEFKAGTTTRLDVAQANVQLARARQALLTARNDRENARVALLNAIGANEGSTLVLTEKFSRDQQIPDVTTAIASARAARPELKQFEAVERAAELAVQSARGQYMPTVALDFTGDMSGNQTNNLYWTRRIAAMASVPLFHGEIAANVGLAKVQLEDVRTQRNATQRDVEQEVRNALASVENAMARMSVAEENVKVAEEALTIAQDRRSAGYGSAVEVDRAEDNYRQAHEDSIAARADAAMAWYALQHATGGIRSYIPEAR